MNVSKYLYTALSILAVGSAILVPSQVTATTGAGIAPTVDLCRPVSGNTINGTIAAPLFTTATGSASNGAVQPGMRVTILATSNGRTQIRTTSGLTGWVASNRLTAGTTYCPAPFITSFNEELN